MFIYYRRFLENIQFSWNTQIKKEDKERDRHSSTIAGVKKKKTSIHVRRVEVGPPFGVFSKTCGRSFPVWNPLSIRPKIVIVPCACLFYYWWFQLCGGRARLLFYIFGPSRPDKKPPSSSSSLFMKCTRSGGRLQNCLFTFFYSISQRRIVMATNNYFVWGVGGGDFDTEKRNSGKSGTISHATGPIWVVLLTRRRPMRSYWFSCHEPNNKYKKKKKKRGWLGVCVGGRIYLSPPCWHSPEVGRDCSGRPQILEKACHGGCSSSSCL
jgi:hypothetical protein